MSNANTFPKPNRDLTFHEIGQLLDTLFATLEAEKDVQNIFTKRLADLHQVPRYNAGFRLGDLGAVSRALRTYIETGTGPFAGKRFATTINNELAIVPAETQIGDIFVQIAHCYHNVIVRPTVEDFSHLDETIRKAFEAGNPLGDSEGLPHVGFRERIPEDYDDNAWLLVWETGSRVYPIGHYLLVGVADSTGNGGMPPWARGVPSLSDFAMFSLH